MMDVPRSAFAAILHYTEALNAERGTLSPISPIIASIRMNPPPAERVVSGSPQDGGAGFYSSCRHSLSKAVHVHVHVNVHGFRQRPVVVNVPRRR